jgi:uncharacterized SAM-binding protein YcdF (DUF218 family)
MMTKPLLIAGCALLAAAVLALRGRRRAARILALASAALVYLSSLTPVANLLLGPLERRYPPLMASGVPVGAGCVVVLGSGYYPQPNLPITAQLDGEGMARIVEGVRLSRQYHLPLLVSGGGSESTGAPAEGYARLARDLGIEDAALTVSAAGTNTRDEAALIAHRLGDRPFLLVTSAAHMPRAMAELQRAGAKPVAAPTAQHLTPRTPFTLRRFLPNSAALVKVELALHEYLGLAAMRLGWQ